MSTHSFPDLIELIPLLSLSADIPTTLPLLRALAHPTSPDPATDLAGFAEAHRQDPALYALLRAALPDQVEAIDALAPAVPGDRWDVFLSYTHLDAPDVHRLARNLHAFGVRVFLDDWEIGAGEVVLHRVEAGLRGSAAGIVAASTTSLSRPWVRHEYAFLATRAIERGALLVPVLVGEAGEVDLPPFLSTRLWVDLRGKPGEAYVEAVTRLVRALRGRGRRGPPTTGSGLEVP